MLKAYCYRLYPNSSRQIQLEKSFGVCRLIYNTALKCRIRAWQSARIFLSACDLINQLPDLKEAFPWIAEVDSHGLQASILNMDKAFRNFFAGAGFPLFKKKSGGSLCGFLITKERSILKKDGSPFPGSPGSKPPLTVRFGERLERSPSPRRPPENIMLPSWSIPGSPSPKNRQSIPQALWGSTWG